MGGQPFPVVQCVICNKTLDLKTDLSADENGKALHADCYFKHIIGEQNNPHAMDSRQ